MGMPFILLLVYGAFAWSRIKIDGIKGEPFDLLGCTDTQYAKGYSHWRFERITVGMTLDEVVAILGEPLNRWISYGGRSTSKRFPEKAHFVGLGHSRSPWSTHYRLRQINLDHGVVAEIRGYFYVDRGICVSFSPSFRSLSQGTILNRGEGLVDHGL